MKILVNDTIALELTNEELRIITASVGCVQNADVEEFFTEHNWEMYRGCTDNKLYDDLLFLAGAEEG